MTDERHGGVVDKTPMDNGYASTPRRVTDEFLTAISGGIKMTQSGGDKTPLEWADEIVAGENVVPWSAVESVAAALIDRMTLPAVWSNSAMGMRGPMGEKKTAEKCSYFSKCPHSNCAAYIQRTEMRAQIAELTRQRNEDRDSLRAMETDRHYTGHIAALTARAEAAERERDHNATSYQASLRLNEHASKLIGEWTARAVSAERERDEEEDKMFEIQNVLENAGFTGGTIVSAVKRLVASVEAATRKTDEMRESMVPEVDHRG